MEAEFERCGTGGKKKFQMGAKGGDRGTNFRPKWREGTIPLSRNNADRIKSNPKGGLRGKRGEEKGCS